MTPLHALFDGRLPKLAMFDLDGTLVDSVPDLAAAVDRMLVRLGRAPAGVERVRLWVGNGARVLVRRALAGDLDHQGVDAAEAEAALALFMDAYADSHGLTRVYPGVPETLDWLREREVALALITNKPSRFLPELLADKGLDGYFRWIVGGDTLPQQKPDPAALFWVMAQAGVLAEEALFVGDSRNDVLAARAAGVACVALSYGYNHGRPIAEEGPALVLDALSALVDPTPGLR
ncbi:phosphoglycolate phosphatase [Azotobacter vinelandii CA]|uniref:Phosphoglycolate phosphatase n=2 Tax=Azotobacter vinelandii TaxID=354 RepID=C1DIV1_AZOVD|nr:phosphoglycolate phosphatase [Azotobacter vinelandii]ACO80770.1 phosphoglycolate phosphatase [Azotobacter vinelandii DJ]AGK13573.1 phosphoglycolate phosphatase [Azotobacter vinelandii CA]AGK18037.1 phosphoglycolate phosphatase [Azotobacter vinelandii CA6]WKN21570.1 phosphoglycolate phosphatase [Azotobacter vinelandii]SFX03863.1 phosphoglycolate phosphatase [Azotobacter vinelandii]